MLSLLELRVIGGEKVLGAQVGKSNDKLIRQDRMVVQEP